MDSGFSSLPPRMEDGFDFAGWGKVSQISDLEVGTRPIHRLDQSTQNTLGAWSATAICGNDITSSCLYVSALCAAHAGVLAPLVLLIVAGVLYLFRSVYAEVGSALPLNGGCYTVLLNTTNKRVAATAACLTILSYVATAVISANEAMHYANHMLPGLPVFEATIGLLGLFALLTIWGIGETAVVALAIFLFHLAVLTLLSVAALHKVLFHPALLIENFRLPRTEGIAHSILFGFAAALLGISGFESSANFIEEQKPGVFPKTLRNMWLAVIVFNPLISLLSIGLLPLADIQQVPPDLLARMGASSWGPWLGAVVSLDAVLVLSGAVLTSFVGVSGLMRRMALDRCLPQFLLKTNRLRGTHHFILIAFFLVCVTILVITGGQISTLAGVYTLSFLSVMVLFALGNMLLKVRRSKLPRETRAGWPTVITAFVAVMIGLLANILLDPVNVEIFAAYFLVVGAVVAVMFLRIPILRGVLFVVQSAVQGIQSVNEQTSSAINGLLKRINEKPMIYFSKADEPAVLNRAVLYVLQNEQTTRLKVVHVYEEESAIPPRLVEHLKMIDHLYPELRVDFVAVKGAFTPELIDALSKRLAVPKNQMFIGTPGHHFPHRIEHLGGVRVIL
jgi:amino acid transporter